MLKHVIADSNGCPAGVDCTPGEVDGLVVATRPLKSFVTRSAFFTNETYGVEMAQNGLYGGTPLLIHNGADDVAWTMSQAVGTDWIENSSDRAYAGSTSLYCNRAEVGDYMQLINNVGPGTDIPLTASYTALTMWINVNNNWDGGDSFSIYGHLNGSPVGNKVNLENYFPYGTTDVWHFINIPLSDMGLSASTIDAFRIECESLESTKPRFYIDNFYMQVSGTPVTYTLEAEKGTWFHVKAFQTIFVDAVTADNADATMMQLSYDKILDVSTTVGYIYRRHSGGGDNPIAEARITNLRDLLSYPYTVITNAVSDGTNTMITVQNTYPPEISFTLKAEELDKITFTIEDNFSELLNFRVAVHGYVEKR